MDSNLAALEDSGQSMRPHTSFGLVLAGGGARGMAHVGALRALNHLGYFPSVIAGVSMGALIAATYSLNPNWYRDLVAMDVSGFPVVPDLKARGVLKKLKNYAIAGRELRALTFGWGAGEDTVDWGRSVIKQLTLGKALEAGHVRTNITATDILTGERIVKSTGDAVDAVYASSALAGILPPLKDGPHLLIDGGYSDSAPVDLVRRCGVDRVLVIDPGQRQNTAAPRNGLEVLFRSIEVTHNAFSKSRNEAADLVLKPDYGLSVGVMDFKHKRRCIAAGVRTVRLAAPQLESLLGPAGQPRQAVSAKYAKD
ncbi:MAG TPA: hypothetical protein DHV57_15360 [Hyphomonas sp.]|jgi:NTE family protein|uniref:patatin-like phospholipase family protein n=1 Tax=uncultured Hyphomonas sp. TaxID=225298 RepID=UPI000C5CF833|nr:hypothetical protein [Hyphomonadaceae bacterium]HBL93795.1 hypothetical protein [Hyphomonas sp.]HCJ18785.1 hypothetical protein [Hyphomonas sp.]|tara:strand:- start:35861 stop:36793 length:933 start_codon:yes stop_codon:yes gene_type:complete